jgi:hypothetical protein
VRTGLTLELLLSAIVTALIAMAIVATNNGTAIQTDERRPIMVVVPETWSEESEDPDHQKSLLFCTVTSDRTRCVQEQS